MRTEVAAQCGNDFVTCKALNDCKVSLGGNKIETAKQAAQKQDAAGKGGAVAVAASEDSGKGGALAPSAGALSTHPWKKQFTDGKKGAVLAEEIKNNSFKLARWIGQAHLADCTLLKLGYVCRKNGENAFNHELLAVQTHNCANFATQIGWNESQAYGTLRHLCEVLLSSQCEDGKKYLFVKDPTKFVLRLYQIPDDALDTEDEESDSDEEDEDFE